MASSYYKDTDKKGKKWTDYKRIKCPDGEIIDMEKLLDEQDWAASALTQKAPHWGKFVSELRFIYTFRVKTQATDGYNLFVNPQFTYHLSPVEKVFVMAHEVMHCLLNHLRRGEKYKGNIDWDTVNIAADYECNVTLTEMKVCKPETIADVKGYWDKKYKDMAFEQILDIMGSKKSGDSMQTNPQQNQNGQQQQQGNSSGQSGKGGKNDKKNDPQSEAYRRGWEIAKKLHKAGKLPTT